MPHREGGGLPPLRRARGIEATDVLTPMEDLRVFGPLRSVMHKAREERRLISPEEVDAAIPLMAQGLLDVLRIKRDGLGSGFVDLDVTKG